MAQVQTSGLATAANGYTGGSIKEDLANYITNISRDETPFSSSIGTSKTSNVNHEWLTDDYATPADNAAVEGAVYSDTSIDFTNRIRKNNYTQIFRKELGVSGTSMATDQAGVANEYAYQLEKNAVELKRDIEFQHVRYEATGNPTGSVKSAGGSSTAHRSGSIFTWVNTVYRASTGAGTINPVPADGTAGTALVFTDNVAITPNGSLNGDNLIRATGTHTNASLSRTHVEGILAAMYETGAKPDIAMSSPALKVRLSQVFSDANSGAVAQRRMEALMMKVGTAVTSVMTDFGFDIALMPNYQMGSGANSAGFDNGILFYESDAIKRSFLRPYEHTRLDNAGDGLRGLLICEETLEVRNPKAVGMLYGVQ